MTRRISILLCILCVWTSNIRGQRTDSLTCGFDHSIKWSQLAAPSLLMTGGTLVSFVPSFHNKIDMGFRDCLQSDGHQRYEIENVLQYAPISSVVILKACGLETRHNWRDIMCLGSGAALISVLLCQSMKLTYAEERPYGGVFNSFPSGHTTTAFFGAEMLRRELGEEYPGIAIAGYAVAAGVGFMRMYNNRHWVGDVLAGAGVGILSTSLMYWLAPYLRF